MAEVAFILGAGASKEAGAPLMKDFLDEAERLWRAACVGAAGEKFQKVFEARSYLSRAHSKSRIEIRNVEDVFTAFQMAKTLRRLGNYQPGDIEALGDAMKTVIVVTLEQTVLVRSDKNGKLSMSGDYGPFAALLKAIRQKTTPQKSIAVITFNYDIALDFAFKDASLTPIYGFEKEESPYGVPLLKLHGSLNWAQCKRCGVIPWTIDSYLSRQGLHTIDHADNVFPLPIGSRIAI